MDRAVQICQIHEQTDKQAVEFGDKQAAAGSILSVKQKGGANANKGSQSSKGQITLLERRAAAALPLCAIGLRLLGHITYSWLVRGVVLTMLLLVSERVT